MNLSETVKNFLYNYPVQHHKKELLKIVETAENAYISRIEELEKKLAEKEEETKPDAESDERRYFVDDFEG